MEIFLKKGPGNNVPVEMMGRFGSVADMVQGLIQIIFTLLLGLFAEWFSLQVVCLVFSAIGVLIAVALLSTIFIPAKNKYFEEKREEIAG
jgi:hypothetical protein